MKSKLFAILLGLLLFVVACGPPPEAPSEDHADESMSESTEEMAEEEPEVVVEEAAQNEVVVEAPAADLAGLTELEYETLEEGNGDKPEAGDFVKIHFIGSLADGTEFANSYVQGGDPLILTYGRSGLFEGFDMAIEMMTIGETARVGIPASLAFGDQGTGVIPPNADLYFDLELVGLAEIEFESLEEGTGEQAMPGDLVQVHYTGTLEDGTVFDSSLDRGEPIEFMLGQGMVIPGWEMGIGMMKEGGKAILTIPPELGYGSAGAGGVIPPNATLTFEVELVSIERIDQ